MAGNDYSSTVYRNGRECLLQYCLQKWEGMTTVVLSTVNLEGRKLENLGVGERKEELRDRVAKCGLDLPEVGTC
jgi:hypothetical protein